MSIRGILQKILKKLGDIFLVKNEYVYNRNGELPVYIINNRIYRIKPEDMYRFLRKRNFKPLGEEGLKKLGYEVRIGEEKPTAETGKTPGTVQKTV